MQLICGSSIRIFLISSFLYFTEIREEAVKEALQKDPLICLDSVRPSKRRQPNSCIPEPGPSHARSKCLPTSLIQHALNDCFYHLLF